MVYPKSMLETHARPRPWQQDDWLQTLQAWLQSHLKTQSVLDEPYSTDMVFVVRVQAGEKLFYFKAGDGSREAKISAYLAQTFPVLTPAVIAYDSERDWLLTKDAGQHLSLVADLNVWSEAVSKLAIFQQRADVSALQALGCPFDPFETLADRGEAFLRNTTYLQSWGMNDEQVAKLEHFIPHLHRAHDTIHALGLQEGPVHGDAQPMNALYDGHATRWFDWSEAHLAHPFNDVGWLLAWTFLPKRDLALFSTELFNTEELLERENVAAHLLGSYLRGWGLPKVALKDVMGVALMQRVLSYHERFHSWQGSKPDWRPQYVNYYLRLLLRTF
jgi:aminoglycoside phosphotransferase (APT) family kinase protein